MGEWEGEDGTVAVGLVSRSRSPSVEVTEEALLVDEDGEREGEGRCSTILGRLEGLRG